MTMLTRWHRPIAALLALSPPIASAWYAGPHDRWDLFERSGSITVAVGLLLASRRYLQHGIAELASLHVDQALCLNAEEDIHSTKLGLALSAFGTLVWGWGGILGWWSFSLILPWTLIALRDVRRDRLHRRERRSAAAVITASGSKTGPYGPSSPR